MMLEANPKDDVQVNKPEAAASLLDKAGKLLVKERPEDATGLYEKVWMMMMNMMVMTILDKTFS